MSSHEIIGLVAIIGGICFDLAGCIGLVRLPDIYNRLQAGTKCVTFGTCGILIGALIMSDRPEIAFKALLCAIFVLGTSPVAAHAISRGAHRSGVKLWKGSVMDKYAEDKEGRLPGNQTEAD